MNSSDYAWQFPNHASPFACISNFDKIRLNMRIPPRHVIIFYFEQSSLWKVLLLWKMRCNFKQEYSILRSSSVVTIDDTETQPECWILGIPMLIWTGYSSSGNIFSWPSWPSWPSWQSWQSWQSWPPWSVGSGESSHNILMICPTLHKLSTTDITKAWDAIASKNI